MSCCCVVTIAGPVGAGVHVENLVNLADAAWDNKELVMRLVSHLDNPDSDVCVDLNGFQVCCYLCVCMCLCVFTCGRGYEKERH